VAVTFVATVWGSNPTGTVTFKRGSTTLGTVSLTGGVASYTTSTLVVGNHSITARYNGDASNPARTSPVLTQNVKGGAAPVVSITSPADQTVYDYPAAVAMLASASTSGGRTLNDVVFFREGAGSSGFAVGGTSPAYNTTWSGLPAGTHVFRARASDNTGAVTLSAPITVQLVVPPSPPAVALSAPAPGTQYTLPATVGLVAAATPGTGASVTKVEFFQGTTLLATDTAAPYGFDWVNPPTGDYSLSAKVTDSAQMSATSDPVAISVRLSGPGETVTFLHSDAAGNALAATDETGNALWKEAYRPYGRRVRFEAGSAGARLWFHGKAQDAETGLQYFGARYYDPFLGRFYGADPKGFDEGNIHSFNRYAYGNNNPLRYRDPDGRAAGLIVLEVGGAALIGGIYYATRSPAEQRELARSVNRAINAVFNENLNEGGSGGGSRANSGADSEGKGKAQEADKDRKRFFDKDQRQRAKDRSRDSDGDATCEYCGVKTTDQPGKPNSAQTDHVKAHSRGGRTTDDNAANSCLTCNASKGAKDFGTEWIPPNRR
jgi:RHS repeat-associated protein